MSSYVQFFLRAEDKFYPLDSFSRSSFIYGLFQDAPYGKVRAINTDWLTNCRYTASCREEETKEALRELRDDLQRVSNFEEHTIEEKLEVIRELRCSIKDTEEELREAYDAISYINFLSGILENVHYGYEQLEASRYLYCGIEVGEPTIEDIEE